MGCGCYRVAQGRGSWLWEGRAYKRTAGMRCGHGCTFSCTIYGSKVDWKVCHTWGNIHDHCWWFAEEMACKEATEVNKRKNVDVDLLLYELKINLLFGRISKRAQAELMWGIPLWNQASSVLLRCLLGNPLQGVLSTLVLQSWAVRTTGG